MPFTLLNTYSYARQVSFLCLVPQWICDVKFIDGSHIHTHTIETNSSTQTAPSFRAGRAASSNYDVRLSYLQEIPGLQKLSKNYDQRAHNNSQCSPARMDTCLPGETDYITENRRIKSKEDRGKEKVPKYKKKTSQKRLHAGENNIP